VDPVARFAEVVRAPVPPLDEAALLIAACARPGLDVAEELARLDAMAAGCEPGSLEALRHHLFVELGFHGNADDYDDPANSFLDAVVERRTGIPITLSLLLSEIGRRVGVELALVGLPGHVLAAVVGRPGTFVDAFHGGALLDRDGCERLLASMRGPVGGFDSAWLDPMAAHAVVLRMLANLKAIALHRRDPSMLVWIQRLRCVVPSVGDGEHRELARLLARWN